ncbi:MAG: hypothetical protein P4L87_20300 [Formivibrio sp.]|nr:hypothetical protein [Formivibrio sp.]
MKPEATVYLQMLVGLNDRTGNRHAREEVVALAKKHGFDGSILNDANDPTITRAPMVSQKLLGIWNGKMEDAVLLLQILELDPLLYHSATERFRSFVAAILQELDQISIYWVPALRRPEAEKIENILLAPAEITKAADIKFPDPRYVFGRSVCKTLSAIRGPLRDGQPSLVVYRSDWTEAPLFIPNSDWTPPHGERGQNDLIDKQLRERYPFTKTLQMEIQRNAEWRCVNLNLKSTGDSMKARTFGQDAIYTFQFALVEAARLIDADPNAEFRDIKGRTCYFRTVDELIAHPATLHHNHEVLEIVRNRLGIALGISTSTSK